MISLQDFKANILGPLLRGEQLAAGEPLTLFAAAFDQPLRYVFESDRWDEVCGAGRRLASASDRVRAILATDGYGSDDLLHSSDGSILALVHDQAIAARWVEAIERAVALETALVTVSTVVRPVTVRELTGGLYQAPHTVIGVPGVNDYQERINRYYGLDSPSTVPKADAVAQRRHFGEVVALMRTLMMRAQESRQIVPFYEALAFTARCASCRTRPAERLDNGPVCGVCLRKRNASRTADPGCAGLVWLEAVGLDRVLEQQRTPADYCRLYREVNETLQIAVPNRAVTLAASNGWGMLALPASAALDVTASALETIAVHYNLKPPVPFIAAVALGTAPGQFRALYELVRGTVSEMRRAIEANTCSLDVRVLGQPAQRFRRPYTVDEARRLIAGIGVLRDGLWPGNAFAELPEQALRGNAGLYYAFERSKLPEASQQVLKRLENVWEMGSVPGPRFYTMLSDGLALARLGD